MPPATLPSTAFRVIVRFCHPIDARTIRRANKELSYVIANTDLVWGEARWRWTQSLGECWNWAVKSGHLEVVKWCLEPGRVNVHVDKDWALRLAAGDGYLDIVKLLLEKGAELHAQDDDGFDALFWAAASARLDVVRLLLEKGANIHAEADMALQIAVERGHLHMVRLLLENGADIHTQNDAPLRGAAFMQDREMVRLLLEKGADGGLISAQAARLRLPYIVHLLSEFGVDPTVAP